MKAQRQSLVVRTVVLFLLGSILIALLMGFGISAHLTQIQEEKGLETLRSQNRQVVELVDHARLELDAEVDRLNRLFVAEFSQGFVLEEAATLPGGAIGVPSLKSGSELMNGRSTEVDRFFAATQGWATLFAKKGASFIRIATSVKTEKGERAVGTELDSNSAAYHALSSGDVYRGPMVLFGRETYASYHPLKDANGRVIGASFISIPIEDALDSLKKKIRAIKVGETGYVYVMDALKSPGLLLVHPAKEGQNIANATDSNGRTFIKDMLKQGSGLIHYPWLNQEKGESKPREKVVVFDTYEPWHWLIATGIYSEEFDAEAIQLRNEIVLAQVIAALVITVLLFLFLRQGLQRPVRKLVKDIQRLATGHLNQALSPAQAPDELGYLQGALEDMRIKLNDVTEVLSLSIQDLALESKALRIQARGAESATQTQVDANSGIAAAIEQISASIEQIAGQCMEATQLTQRVDRATVDSAAVISQAMDAMQEISHSVQDASQSIQSLDGHALEISRVLTVIKDITEQTSLLALNAAIEAARAGESGRGFAVVADEVRKLSGRTQEATIEITHMIQKIQEGSKNSASKMGRVVHFVKTGVDHAARASQEVVTMRTIDHQMVQSVEEIASAVQEQNAAVQDIARRAMSFNTEIETVSRSVAVIRGTSDKLDSIAAVVQDNAARINAAHRSAAD